MLKDYGMTNDNSVTTKFDSVLMDTAFIWAELSTCKRRQVGCVLAKDTRILATGYNGTISGRDNRCESVYETPCSKCGGSGNDELNEECEECDGSGWIEHTNTLPSVLHAEQNVLMFAAKHGLSTNNTTLYCTDAPCITCAKLIAQAGITKVFYARDYHDHSGLQLLMDVGIKVQKLERD